MLAIILNRSSDLGDSSTTNERWPSPVGIGGILEQFPSSLTIFPEVPNNTGSGARSGLRMSVPSEGAETAVGSASPNLASTPQAASASHLTEPEMRDILAQTGWAGRDLEEALRVSFGESVGWQPRIMGDGGRAHGLFQIHLDPWGRYCEMTAEQLLTPLGNARCARLIFEYEQHRNYPRWSNWSVKP